ncbi:tubby-like F-box protein 14 [Iris pallida]|uniref:Tubby-like F-box protein 14 n=1 Tax=Iris pallida TaxID=29817 RepID=A0AAX6FER3_IRIPA|nr:tubby-like F-box protein 14 [Iris pallida]
MSPLVACRSPSNPLISVARGSPTLLEDPEGSTVFGSPISLEDPEQWRALGFLTSMEGLV